MSKELRQVANGFDNKVKAYSGYDVNGYRFHTASYERARPHRKTTNSGVCTPGTDGLEYHGIIKDIYELEFYGFETSSSRHVQMPLVQSSTNETEP